MLERLRRHPFPVEARFDVSLVLTYALPPEHLTPLLPPGLELDTFGDLGFLAVALVQTRSLRPAGFPAFLGQDFFLSGYRIFTRYRNLQGRRLRGLRILRSDADRRLMVWLGNLLTHYGYHLVDVDLERDGPRMEIRVDSRDGETDLHVVAHLDRAELPPGSPFGDFRTALPYAGPLPFTFSYEPETHSMMVVQGVREHWEARPVAVEVKHCAFLERFGGAARLANVFVVEDVDYAWKRGVREPLP